MSLYYINLVQMQNALQIPAGKSAFSFSSSNHLSIYCIYCTVYPGYSVALCRFMSNGSHYSVKQYCVFIKHQYREWNIYSGLQDYWHRSNKEKKGLYIICSDIWENYTFISIHFLCFNVLRNQLYPQTIAVKSIGEIAVKLSHLSQDEGQDNIEVSEPCILSRNAIRTLNM